MGQKKKNPAAVALAKKRLEKISPERRSEIAKQAGEARWEKERKKSRAAE
jgi:hypothetical protein